ncbi:aminopeptidase N [Muriicola jejuensis]|uniref:Aminopeptidase N n=1 Tax=Muriicola jejuensis TaxID=504488 RepID=A0A6P0UK03_9FLAO|nr:M1 family metallopeptidase [Muriicola jejuensis]NER11383.1 M1 family peptidase [Muriicola jejuensis]SMP21065.1 aminopeptidase N [Muriicola jejuensis]
MKIVLTILTFFLALCVGSAQGDRVSDFLTGDIHLEIDPVKETVTGFVQYRFVVTEKTDSVALDARQMEITSISLNGKKVRRTYDGRTLVVRKKFRPNKEYSLDIAYSCKPAQALYFLGWQDSIPLNEQVWTQGQGKYNSHWVPSFDLMTEKVIFNLHITADKVYEVVANGKLKGKEDHGQTQTWEWEMQSPMSSYLLAFAMGKYGTERKHSGSGIPLDVYFYPGDSLLIEPTYRYSREIFDFLEGEIGFPYPWQNYKMVPVRDFLYAGMENTGTTLFSDAFVIDSTAFVDRNFINVNAHELAHQWFGNLVTEVDASSHWLHEGFASYYAWLAEKEMLGEDHFYWMLYNKAESLYEQTLEGRGESLLDPRAGSLTFYDKGGIALLMLRKTLGDEAFRKAIAEFLRTFSYKNATVSDFMEMAETNSGRDLKEFRSVWLEGTSFPYQDVMDHLRNSYPAVDLFMRLRQELTTSNAKDESILESYWGASVSSQFRKRLILRYHRSLSPEFLKKAFETQDIQIRQAVSLIPGPITPDLLPFYESLLADKSYTTLENALYRLWLYQPEKRSYYLDKTREIEGFHNKNIRQLWLLLAILTNDFASAEERESFRDELFGYTAPYHPMEVRQLAFSLIGEVFPYSVDNLRDLVSAAVHPSWQFREFARNLLKDQLNDPLKRKQFETILGELRGDEYKYLKQELEGK